MDATNSRTGQRVGCGDDHENTVLLILIIGASGGDDGNDVGTRLTSFATDCKAAQHHFYQHTLRTTAPARTTAIGLTKREYVPTRQAYRPTEYLPGGAISQEVVPQPLPPAEADSDHNIPYPIHERSPLWSSCTPTNKHARCPKVNRLTGMLFMSDNAGE